MGACAGAQALRRGAGRAGVVSAVELPEDAKYTETLPNGAEVYQLPVRDRQPGQPRFRFLVRRGDKIEEAGYYDSLIDWRSGEQRSYFEQ